MKKTRGKADCVGSIYNLKTENFKITLLPCRAYEVSFLTDVASVGFVFDSQQGVHALGTDCHSDFYASANSQAYLPAGCDVFSGSEHGGEYLKVSILHPDDVMSLGPEPFSHVADKEAIKTAEKLRKLLLSGQGKNDFDFVDQLVVDWICKFDTDNSIRPERGISSAGMKQIEAYINLHLGESLDVLSLASAFGLSPGYFSREFKKAFGQSPYDFVINRRVSCARKVLENSNEGIMEIALEHGFNTHAHMSAVFKRKLGISPRVIR